MTEPLRVDTGLVLEAGGRLQSLAAAIPPPPEAYRPSGADALSAAIAAKVTEVVDPVIAQLPVTKEELTRYAQNVVAAANTYDTVDRQLAEEILKRLDTLDEAASGEGTGAGPAGVGPGGGGAVTAPVGGGTAAGGAAAPTTGAAQQGGQMAQMMQMPMQMAQQAAQVPTQMGGMIGAVPQAAGQGVQQAVQQVAQLSDMAGKDAQDGNRPDQAAPGEASIERAPSEGSAPAVSEPGPETAL